jgi:hypothetical protein
MAAGKYDFYIEQGATFNRTIVWKDSSEDPVNLTGYTARMQVRKTVNSDTTILSLTTENGKIALGGALGTITLTLAPADTETLESFCGVYDLELKSGSDFVTRLLEGQVTISREVTR